jgi:hypothetical protein
LYHEGSRRCDSHRIDPDIQTSILERINEERCRLTSRHGGKVTRKSAILVTRNNRFFWDSDKIRTRPFLAVSISQVIDFDVNNPTLSDLIYQYSITKWLDREFGTDRSQSGKFIVLLMNYRRIALVSNWRSKVLKIASVDRSQFKIHLMLKIMTT